MQLSLKVVIQELLMLLEFLLPFHVIEMINGKGKLKMVQGEGREAPSFVYSGR